MEGQRVFGGIEEGSRRSFMSAVDDRSEAMLLPIIETFIEKGTTIISDCWRDYCNLEKHGHVYDTVNHSKEFVNQNGDHTNKIEDIGVKRRQSFRRLASGSTPFHPTWQSSFGNMKTGLKCS